MNAFTKTSANAASASEQPGNTQSEPVCLRLLHFRRQLDDACNSRLRGALTLPPSVLSLLKSDAGPLPASPDEVHAGRLEGAYCSVALVDIHPLPRGRFGERPLGLRRTPGPLSLLAGRNSTPASSNAFCTFHSVVAAPRSSVESSRRLTVAIPNPVFSASSLWLKPSNARAAFTCAAVIIDLTASILNDTFCISEDTSGIYYDTRHKPQNRKPDVSGT